MASDKRPVTTMRKRRTRQHDRFIKCSLQYLFCRSILHLSNMGDSLTFKKEGLDLLSLAHL